jgi:hypothetical protein
MYYFEDYSKNNGTIGFAAYLHTAVYLSTGYPLGKHSGKASF